MTRAAECNPGAVSSRPRPGEGSPAWCASCWPASHAGPLVLRAQCVDLGDPGLPYLAMVDLVRAVAGDRDGRPGGRGRCLGCTRSRPALSTRPVSGDPVDESRRLQLFDARAPCSPSPAGSAAPSSSWSRNCSGSTLRRRTSSVSCESVTAARLLMVATVRTAGWRARARIRQLLSELGRLASVRRLDLEPFDAGEVQEYLARVTGDERTRCRGRRALVVRVGTRTTWRRSPPGSRRDEEGEIRAPSPSC